MYAHRLKAEHHGTPTGYKYGCRETCCTDAMRKWKANRRRQIRLRARAIARGERPPVGAPSELFDWDAALVRLRKMLAEVYR